MAKNIPDKKNIEKKLISTVKKAIEHKPKYTSDKHLEPKQEELVHKKPGFLHLFKKKEEELKGIEYFKKQLKKKERKRATVKERKHMLLHYIGRAGITTHPDSLSKKFFNLTIAINLIISTFLIYHFSTTLGVTWTTILLSIMALWVLIFVLLLFTLWAIFYLVVDLKIFKRKVNIEDVLPDYLQLTSSNIKAGMTIDRALWYAVRPRFGVLANEIEIVAKETMRGEDLKTALKKFSDKYNSVLLKRSISLLIEGIEAGGEIGNLLNNISLNIQENKIMRREMAANVTTYVIFISFATVAAAPVLFALSGVLIQVISNLGTSLGGAISGASTTGLAISFSGAGIQFSDFRIFAVVSLIISSFFSAIIISTIKDGNAKMGFKYIPIFMVITITLFFIANKLLGKVVGVFI